MQLCMVREEESNTLDKELLCSQKIFSANMGELRLAALENIIVFHLPLSTIVSKKNYYLF